MRALAGIGVFEEVGAVELGKAVSVAREVRGSPIENNADAGLMAAIDKFLKIGGRSEAAGGGVVAEGLVAPGAVKGMFHDGEQFDMGVAEILDVGDELLGEFAVGEPAIFFFWNAAPGAEVNFVN